MQYFAPNFLNEALVVLERYGAKARVLAGGTLLGPELRADSGGADAIVNLKRIPSLVEIEFDGHDVRIGALATAHALANDPMVLTHVPLIARAAATLGARQLRSVATIGGNVCSGHHTADLATALLASDARLVHANARDGEGELPMERFLSPGFAGLGSGALLTGFRVPARHAHVAYAKMQTRRAFEMAIVSVAAVLGFDGAIASHVRIALGGAAPTPILATGAEAILIGQPLTAGVARQAATVASDVDADPRDDANASADYRRQLVRVLTERALLDIVEQRVGGRR